MLPELRFRKQTNTHPNDIRFTVLNFTKSTPLWWNTWIMVPPQANNPTHRITLGRLRPFHQAMRKQGLSRAAFSYRNNKATLEVVFIVDESPYVLHIATRGVHPFAFEVDVLPGYQVVPYLGDAFRPLLDALGVEWNPTNRFSTTAFFRELDSNVPHGMVKPVEAEPHQLTLRRESVEESEKVYFIGWTCHGEGRHVTTENLNKTKRLIGKMSAARCARQNVSSNWTADSNLRKKLSQVPPSVS